MAILPSTRSVASVESTAKSAVAAEKWQQGRIIRASRRLNRLQTGLHKSGCLQSRDYRAAATGSRCQLSLEDDSVTALGRFIVSSPAASAIILYRLSLWRIIFERTVRHWCMT